MKSPPNQEERDVPKAHGELAWLKEQAEIARAELSRLQRLIAAAEHQLDGSHGILRIEANEQMLASALRAHEEAETAASRLEEVARSAELDGLTGLPNRTLMLDRLTHAIANAKRHETRLAVLFVDLDNFKQINDTLGHAIGDQALQLAAQCLTSSVREADTVSRHGGDEFLILLDEVSGVEDAAVVADKVIAQLGNSHVLGDHRLKLKGSIGISIYPDDGEDALALIAQADAAMYLAKRHLSSSVVHGEKAMSVHGLEPLPLESSPSPLTVHEAAQATHERRYAQLREANERLLMAVLNAQDQLAAAKQETLTRQTHKVRNPSAPFRRQNLPGRPANQASQSRLDTIITRHEMPTPRWVGHLIHVLRVGTGKPGTERQGVDPRTDSENQT